MKSAFVRKKDAPPPAGMTAMVKELPLGCYVSSLNSNVLLTSLGLHELDELCGGGCVVGGLAAVEQDEGTRHWKALARYFASEGAASGQGLVVVGAHEADPAAFVRTDVACVTDSMPAGEQVAAQPLSVDGVTIAWRYKAQLKEKSVSGAGEPSKWPRRCHWFDLARPADPPAADSEAVLHSGDLEATWSAIERALERFNRAAGDAAVRAPPIARLVLLGFGSALWPPHAQLGLFLLRLRALVRRSLWACFVCLAPGTPPAWSHFFDQSMRMSSFQGEGAAAAAASSFPGYAGTLTLRRTAGLFAAAQWRPEVRVFLFRRTRRALQLERLYMPPEDRAQSDLACATSGGSGPAAALDF